jgi:O-antigen/teichoic acid export membrane protein
MNQPRGRTSFGRRRSTKWNLFFAYTHIFYAVVSGLVLVPLYLRFIPKEVYGAWLASGNILIWISIVDLGLADVIMQRTATAYAAGKTNEIIPTVLAGVAFASATAAVVFFGGWIAASHLQWLLQLPENFDTDQLQTAFRLAATGSALSIIGFSIGSANQGLDGALPAGISASLGNLVSLCSIVFLVLSGWGIAGIAAGFVVRGIFIFVGNAGYLLRRAVSDNFPFRFQRAPFRELLGFSAFTALGRAGVLLAGNMDAFLVARALGAGAVPVLILTRRGPDTFLMILGRPANAVMPSVANLAGSNQWDKARVILSRLMRITFWSGGLGLAAFLALNDDFVRIWVGADFFAGHAVSAGLVLFLIVALFVRTMAMLCIALGDIKKIYLMEFYRSLLCIVLMVVGVYFYGLLGLVVAQIAAMVIVSMAYLPRTFARLLRLSRGEKTALWWESGKSVLAACCLFAAFTRFQPHSWIQLGLIAGGLTAGYFVILWLLSSSFRAETKALADRAMSLVKPVSAG